MERGRKAGGQDRPKAGKECKGGTPDAVESWCELQSAQSQGLHPSTRAKFLRGHRFALKPRENLCYDASLP